MKNLTIFKQLLVLVILPVVCALVFLAWFNLHKTAEILKNAHDTKNKIMADEIQHILEFMDDNLVNIERSLDDEISEFSNELVHNVFRNTDNIENADLDSVRAVLQMNPNFYDIYVINAKGVIVNTTFEKDLGLPTFEKFGEGHKKLILDILRTKGYKNGSFSPEQNSNLLRKYTYQCSKDSKYVIELGVYSKYANAIVNKVETKLNNLAKENGNILSVDLFIGKDNPVSFNNKGAVIDSTHMKDYQYLLDTRHSVLTGQEVADGYKNTIYKDGYDAEDNRMKFQYTYMPRSTSVYKDSVIRIVTDMSRDDELINHELFIFSLIFGLTIVVLFIVILFATRSIIKPLDRLVEKVNKISRGNLSERANVKGSKEITKLAFHFNQMLEKLEEFYNDLEQKVIERTAEISQQKEEIEAQRDQIEAQRDKLAETNKNLELAYTRIEAQAQRITDSIHYAKRIQNAILPTSSQLKDIIKDHFVLYKPKDIVSGDFYWASQKNGRSIIVAADCTGHGVPGAFMSMIGNTLLNKIVNEHGVVSPDKILNDLRHEIISSLKQTGRTNETRDGMDVVVLSVDYENNKLEYAGANNPLFIVKNGELEVFKGDKMPVGYHIGDEKDFSKHVIDVKAGESYYIFTDGYQDQFGGEYDRKFMVKRFKALLADVYDKPMEEQKDILNQTINDWMFNTKQVDDILVIGMKV